MKFTIDLGTLSFAQWGIFCFGWGALAAVMLPKFIDACYRSYKNRR